MNKRRYSNRRRKNILRVFILLMTIIITVVMWRTIKIDVQVGELTLPKILQSEKSFADTSGEWNLILVDRNHYIPNNYQVELTELSNGKKVDSRIYPELQQMFNDARAEGLALFVREGYRTTEEQQKIADCLSVIDTIITEQSNKVEQLKAHKKGLMQGLFPSLEEADV